MGMGDLDTIFEEGWRVWDVVGPVWDDGRLSLGGLLSYLWMDRNWHKIHRKTHVSSLSAIKRN